MRATVFRRPWTVPWCCTSSCWIAGRRVEVTGQSLDRLSQSWTSWSETQAVCGNWPTAQYAGRTRPPQSSVWAQWMSGWRPSRWASIRTTFPVLDMSAWTQSFTSVSVNWLKWGWLWPATRRRFCPTCRACRPRGRMFKYNSFPANTQRDGVKLDAPVKSLPCEHGNGSSVLEPPLGFKTHRDGDSTDAWLLHLLRSFPNSPLPRWARAAFTLPASRPPLWSSREAHFGLQGWSDSLRDHSTPNRLSKRRKEDFKKKKTKKAQQIRKRLS